MSVVDRVCGILASICPWQKEANILLVGPPNAGKSTLLHMLAYGILVEEHQPTQYPTSEEFTIGRIKFKAFDVCGNKIPWHQVLRDYNYLEVPFFDAVVYVVDANDHKSIGESKSVLRDLLSAECFAKVPFLILGNKIDLPHAASEFELRCELGLPYLTKLANVNACPLEFFRCSVVRQMGYDEGLGWLSQHI